MQPHKDTTAGCLLAGPLAMVEDRLVDSCTERWGWGDGTGQHQAGKGMSSNPGHVVKSSPLYVCVSFPSWAMGPPCITPQGLQEDEFSKCQLDTDQIGALPGPDWASKIYPATT